MAASMTSDTSPDLLGSYRSVRAHTDALTAPLSDEDQCIQTMPDVSPTKWHRAHVTWFFETFLCKPHLAGYIEHDPAFGFLFNSYYETIGKRHPRPERGYLSRPSCAEVTAYRRHVDAAMERLLCGAVAPEVADLVSLGLHHEQQHQELILMDIKHVLSCNPALWPAYRESCNAAAAGAGEACASEARWVSFDGGEIAVGHDGCGFAFDNEGPRHQVLTAPFRLADRPVTCAQWLAFMADGGYDTPTLWLSDGWGQRSVHGWDSPAYWHLGDDGWQVFTLGGLKAVAPNEPVCHLSYYEADAFARWAGARLPTEFEWEHAVTGLPQVGNIGDGAGLHPASAPTAPDAGAGVSVPLQQMYGDVWEWTSSPYSPYPGFRVAPGAVGEYNGKFMINQMVLRGGCCATPEGHIRPTYRNFFHPHTRWHFSGLRLAVDA
ncbi:MAG: ergothioneine biosynthesis protein EgtB [Acidimicrobiales bacterium]|nr:ergothioneine biosynthesis protein EgtB [Acidimicrobiales bacterium]MYH74298.1 ergothioneine biosynthesis protein EgtB [Acidimicrobiales bacterium]MYK71966.1 ergothioneine biosynthesis protein EgtB [Acidimicrobiales bacterium]